MLCTFTGTEGSNPSLSVHINHTGEMAEWLKAPASKAGVPYGYRGFESLSLRFHGWGDRVLRNGELRTPSDPEGSSGSFIVRVMQGCLVAPFYSFARFLCPT